MARKGEPGVGEREGGEPEDFIPDDIDALLSAANAAATEAQRAAAAGEIASVSEKRRQSKAAVERAEELERTYALLSAEDSGVDHVGYEWALQAAEEETGVAAPEKAGEVIGGLRKVGDALRRLAAIDPKTPELEQRIEELERVKAELFERARDLAMQAIEAVKLKYQGEESEFERTFRQLQESPLTAHLEFPPDSPEAREAALKMEITELFLRPVVQSLTDWEKETAGIRSRVGSARRTLEAHRQKTQTNRDDRKNLLDARRALKGVSYLDNSVTQLDDTMLASGLGQEADREEGKANGRDTIHRTNLVVLEGNKMRLEVILDNVASEGNGREESFRAALTELRQLLENDHRSFSYGGYVQEALKREGYLSNPVKRLLEAFLYHGEVLKLPSMESSTDERTAFGPLEQLFMDRTKHNRGDNLRTWRPDAVHVGAVEPRDAVGLANIKRATAKVLSKNVEDPVIILTAERKAEGWKESKLGALVPPGGDARKADREFAAMLERLSHPIASAERAFDAKGEGGEIKVYTLEQAKDLLRRARRDAQKLLLETRGHLERETGEAAKRGERVKGLTEENTGLREALAKAREEARTLSEARDADALTHKGEQRAAASENRALQKRLEETQAAMTSAATALSTALERKAPMLGGDKALRESITGILEELEKQQGK